MAFSADGKFAFLGSGNSVIVKPRFEFASCIWSSGPFRLQAQSCSAKFIILNDLNVKRLLEQHGAST